MMTISATMFHSSHQFCCLLSGFWKRRLLVAMVLDISICFCGATPGECAEPLFEEVPVFVSRTAGYNLIRIPGIIATPRGTVLAYGEARKQGGDWDDIDLVLRRSPDGGKTWDPLRVIGHVSGPHTKNPIVLDGRSKNIHPEDVTYNNLVAIPDATTGEVHFVYCLEYQRCFWMTSKDDGLTFTEPVEITSTFESFRPEYEWKVLATGPGHGIQLKNGRLVIPVWLSTGTGRNAHHPSVTSTIYSDDHGRTWQRGEIAVPNSEEFKDPNETCLVELADGRVMLNVRNESKEHRRIVVFSADGATAWSRPAFHDELIEPVCMASTVRLTKSPDSDRNRLLFANPDSNQLKRENLTLRLSYDEGETWPVKRVLESGPSGYSDLAVLPDGIILCAFEKIAVKNNPLPPEIVVARLNLEWLSSGKDTLEKRSQ